MSVVVVRFGLREMENSALSTLVDATESKDWGLRVVDNWGNPETLVRLWNRTAEEEVSSGAEAVCFLNSDCWVGPGWDAECLYAIKSGQASIVGPQCNTGPQTAPPEVPVPAQDERGWPDVAGVARAAAMCRRLWSLGFRESEVFGHCYVVSAQALKAARGFEAEIEAGYTLYGAEQSFSRRLRAIGMRTGTAAGAYCYHAGEASGRAAQARGVFNLSEEREKGRRLFFGDGHSTV